MSPSYNDPLPDYMYTQEYVDRQNQAAADANAYAQTAPQSGQYPDYFAPEPDPYAQWGGQTAYNNLVSGFEAQKQNIYGTSTDAARTSGRQLQGSILDFLDQYQGGQRQVDERGVQNELAKRQGTSSILDMVGRGIRSGGVVLNNKNAADSSAAGAIGRAYGSIGQRQMSNVGNQYEMENRQIGLAQQDLAQQAGTFGRKYEESKLGSVDNIVAQARDSLAQLDAAMLEADLPTRIAIEQEKETIRQQVLAELSQYDQQLAQGRSAVNPMDANQRRATAAQLQNAGTAAANPFNFSTDTPVQFQNTGPFASELPIFTFNKNRREG